MFSENDKQLNLKTGRAKSKIRFLPFSLSNKQPLQEKERERGGSNKNWEGRTARSGQLGTGQLKNPLANWGSGKLKLKLKLKSYPVPKSLHVSYLIFCYKLKDFNDTLDDGDDRSANWNCLLKVRITEQPGRQAGRHGEHAKSTSTRPRPRAATPAPWSSERPKRGRQSSRHLDGCENATQWTTGQDQ